MNTEGESVIIKPTNIFKIAIDGVTFKQMRVCHMWNANEKIRFGVYACSPEDSSFKAIFTKMEITECKWLAHDGQQPDSE